MAIVKFRDADGVIHEIMSVKGEPTEIAQETGQSETAVMSQKAVTDSLADKANVDGYYEDLTAGNAEQLISSVETVDKVPYLFRTSGGSASIGNRVKEKIVGGTVNVNQLVNSLSVGGTRPLKNVDWTILNDGKSVRAFTVPGEVSSGSDFKILKTLSVITGHRYLVLSPNGDDTKCYIRVSFNGIEYKGTNGAIFVGDATRSTYLHFAWKENVSFDFTFTPMIFDLTAWFGSAIADTITTPEQAYALGVPHTYIPYNTGTLMSVNLLKKVVTGINQWDEEWEVGAYNSLTGNKISGQNQIRNKNKIPVIPSAQYHLSIPNSTFTYQVAATLYDKNENYIGYVYCANTTFTLPSNAYYMCFYTGASLNYGEVYKNDICVNLSWNGSHNGEYHPYEKTEYTMPSGELRGIPKLDANGKLYYDGDEYFADGTINRRYGVVDLGTADWTFWENGRFSFDLPTMNLNTPLVCSAYPQSTAFVGDKIIANSNYWFSPNNVVVYDNSYSDAAAFKTAMTGEYLVYELATPTTEQGTPYTELQKVDDWGTEEFVTAEGNIVPVGHESDYFANLRDKLQNLPGNASADGDYIVRQTGSQMILVPVPTELPSRSALASSKTYALKVVNGTLQWVEEA